MEQLRLLHGNSSQVNLSDSDLAGLVSPLVTLFQPESPVAGEYSESSSTVESNVSNDTNLLKQHEEQKSIQNVDNQRVANGHFTAASEGISQLNEKTLLSEFVRYCNLESTPSRAHPLMDLCTLIKMYREKRLIDEIFLKQRDVEFQFQAHKTRYERKIGYKAFKAIARSLATKKYPQPSSEELAIQFLLQQLASQRKDSAALAHRSSNSIVARTTAIISVFERLSDERYFPEAYKRHHQHAIAQFSLSPQQQSPNTSPRRTQLVDEHLPPVFERLSNAKNFSGIHRKLASMRIESEPAAVTASIGHQQRQQSIQHNLECF
jgi:hypothetical protein